MAWFMLTLGLSTGFGAVAHGTHYQLGTQFFDAIFFITNAFSLISIYFCFKAAYIYYTLMPNKYIIGSVVAWIAILMISSLIQGEFSLIKIHAGLVLIYSLVIHFLMYKRAHDKGNRLIVTGILISFLSIIVHSLKFSLDEWFNYKDIAHTIMIITLIFIYRGALLNAKALDKKASINA